MAGKKAVLQRWECSVSTQYFRCLPDGISWVLWSLSTSMSHSDPRPRTKWKNNIVSYPGRWHDDDAAAAADLSKSPMPDLIPSSYPEFIWIEWEYGWRLVLCSSSCSNCLLQVQRTFPESYFSLKIKGLIFVIDSAADVNSFIQVQSDLIVSIPSPRLAFLVLVTVRRICWRSLSGKIFQFWFLGIKLIFQALPQSHSFRMLSHIVSLNLMVVCILKCVPSLGGSDTVEVSFPLCSRIESSLFQGSNGSPKEYFFHKEQDLWPFVGSSRSVESSPQEPFFSSSSLSVDI
jgi:hypothetical protein